MYREHVSASCYGGRSVASALENQTKRTADVIISVRRRIGPHRGDVG